jgi:methyl coenzyme M reductase beta subunit
MDEKSMDLLVMNSNRIADALEHIVSVLEDDETPRPSIRRLLEWLVHAVVKSE